MCLVVAAAGTAAAAWYGYQFFSANWLVIASLLPSQDDAAKYVLLCVFVVILIACCGLSYVSCRRCGQQRDCHICGMSCSATGGHYCAVCC